MLTEAADDDPNDKKIDTNPSSATISSSTPNILDPFLVTKNHILPQLCFVYLNNIGALCFVCGLTQQNICSKIFDVLRLKSISLYDVSQRQIFHDWDQRDNQIISQI